jgi:hypothetical protein
MCYGALLNGETDRPLGDLIRGEVGSAARVGAVAAVAVLVVLARNGTGLAVLGVTAAGALVLGTALHLTVFLAGVGLVRWRTTERAASRTA